MIRRTISRTMSSTFMVRVPSNRLQGIPIPNGTGFFISPDGYFITARHVIDNVSDFPKVWLMRPGETPPALVQHVMLVRDWDEFDIALLKADFSLNQEKAFLAGKTGFPYLEIEFEQQIEGAPVYAYGFPLPKVRIEGDSTMAFMEDFITPRVTSAIIASRFDVIGPRRRSGDPKFYAIDKALNYGNSGGPIVLKESGRAISVCVRFQPVSIPQEPPNPPISVTIPSLYGITSSLRNIQHYLESEIDLPY